MNKEQEIKTGPESEYQWGDLTRLTAQEVRDLLTDSDKYISEALKRTNKAGHKFMGEPMGQEFGFVGFGDLTKPDREIHVSPLYQGQENNIELYELSQQYLEANPELPQTGIFDFHSHTYLYLALLKKFQFPEVLESDDREVNHFSLRDLRSYYHLTRENPYYIRALGTEKDDRGQILLVSFSNHDSWANFNYDETYERSKQDIRAGNDSLAAYLAAGLNVATIPVDLTKQPILQPAHIERASKILAVAA